MENTNVSVNQISRSEVEELLKGSIFKNVDNFIAGYNAGLLSRGNKVVKEFAEKIVEAYPEIELRDKQRVLVKKPKEEMEIKSMIEELNKWLVLVQFKRDLLRIEEQEGLSLSEIFVAFEGGQPEVFFKDVQVVNIDGVDVEDTTDVKVPGFDLKATDKEVIKEFFEEIEVDLFKVNAGELRGLDASFAFNLKVEAPFKKETNSLFY